jgi:hypothetical protein
LVVLFTYIGGNRLFEKPADTVPGVLTVAEFGHDNEDQDGSRATGS